MSFQRGEQPVVLKGTEAARAFLSPCVTGDHSGDWWVAHVDERVRCIHLAPYCPNHGRDGVDPGLAGAILGDAVQLGSAAVLVGSRRAAGSDDLALQTAATRELAEAAEAIDVAVLDHLLFGGDDSVSLRQVGLF